MGQLLKADVMLLEKMVGNLIRQFEFASGDTGPLMESRRFQLGHELSSAPQAIRETVEELAPR
jgi:hypothetical protein